MASFRLTLNDLVPLVNSIAAEAVAAGAVTFADAVKDATPTNRKRTRRFTKSVHKEGSLSAYAGVMFPPQSRYRTDGTDTRKAVVQVWNRRQRATLAEVENAMQNGLANMKPLFSYTIESKG